MTPSGWSLPTSSPRVISGGLSQLCLSLWWASLAIHYKSGLWLEHTVSFCRIWSCRLGSGGCCQLSSLQGYGPWWMEVTPRKQYLSCLSSTICSLVLVKPEKRVASSLPSGRDHFSKHGPIFANCTKDLWVAMKLTMPSFSVTSNWVYEGSLPIAPRVGVCVSPPSCRLDPEVHMWEGILFEAETHWIEVVCISIWAAWRQT